MSFQLSVDTQVSMLFVPLDLRTVYGMVSTQECSMRVGTVLLTAEYPELITVPDTQLALITFLLNA